MTRMDMENSSRFSRGETSRTAAQTSRPAIVRSRVTRIRSNDDVLVVVGAEPEHELAS